MRIATTAVAALLAGCATAPPASEVDERLPEARPVTVVMVRPDGGIGETVTLPMLVLPESEWRRHLTPLGFSVLRRGATELAYTGKYHKHKEAGIYRCAGCGTALFRSGEKFDSGTGWPSFRTPVAKENVYTRVDESLGVARDEVLCRRCDGHLGHVFPDGPEPTGLRYCMNSAALRFEPYR